MALIEGGEFGDKEYFKVLVDSVNDMEVSTLGCNVHIALDYCSSFHFEVYIRMETVI